MAVTLSPLNTAPLSSTGTRAMASVSAMRPTEKMVSERTEKMRSIERPREVLRTWPWVAIGRLLVTP
jgi:hypothetical protein